MTGSVRKDEWGSIIKIKRVIEKRKRNGEWDERNKEDI